MKYLAVLVLILSGCCTTRESTRTSHRDSLIVFQPSPVHVDSVLPGPIVYLPSPCDTGAILNLLGGFEVAGNSQDSTAHYRAKYNALSRRFELAVTHQPETKLIPVDNSIVSTYTQGVPFIQILGYTAIGMFVMLGIVVAIKGFL